MDATILESDEVTLQKMATFFEDCKKTIFHADDLNQRKSAISEVKKYADLGHGPFMVFWGYLNYYGYGGFPNLRLAFEQYSKAVLLHQSLDGLYNLGLVIDRMGYPEWAVRLWRISAGKFDPLAEYQIVIRQPFAPNAGLYATENRIEKLNSLAKKGCCAAAVHSVGLLKSEQQYEAYLQVFEDFGDPVVFYHIALLIGDESGSRYKMTAQEYCYRGACSGDVASMELYAANVVTGIWKDDLSLAKSFIEKSAFRGGGRAHFDLGYMLRKGLGCKVDKFKGAKHLLISSELGCAEALPHCHYYASDRNLLKAQKRFGHLFYQHRLMNNMPENVLPFFLRKELNGHEDLDSFLTSLTNFF